MPRGSIHEVNTETQIDQLQETPDLTNKSVIKATVLLRQLGRHPHGITVTELAQAVGMSRPTAFRLLLSLEQAGFVDRIDNRYMLGWEVARLGRLADPHTGLAARVQPILDVLAAKLNETIDFAVVKGELEYDLIAEASGSHMLNVSQQYIGQQYPLHASATGKLLLAELTDEKIKAILPEKLQTFTRQSIQTRAELILDLHEVRQQGYSTLDNELEDGLFAVGCPVRDVTGELIGVLTANGPTQRMKTGRLPAMVEQLKESASAICKSMI